MLRAVRVRDRVEQEEVARARLAREHVADEPAGARLGDRERPARACAARGRRRRERVVALAVDRRRRGARALRRRRARQSVARGVVRSRRAREDLHLDLGEVRAVADGHAGERRLDAGELLADDALGQAERAEADLIACRSARARGCAATTCSSNMRFISRGTPGMKNARARRRAATREAGRGADRVRQDRRRRRESRPASRSSRSSCGRASRSGGGCARARLRRARASTPSAAATASVVRSSVVGPRPPVHTMTLARAREALERRDDARAVVVDDGVLDDLEAEVA